VLKNSLGARFRPNARTKRADFGALGARFGIAISSIPTFSTRCGLLGSRATDQCTGALTAAAGATIRALTGTSSDERVVAMVEYQNTITARKHHPFALEKDRPFGVCVSLTPALQSEQSSSRAPSEPSPPPRATRLFCCLCRRLWAVWTRAMPFPRELPLLDVRSGLGVVASCL
jgi:hypothetical protein